MIIEPKIRGFICLTAHPKGCEQNVINQIDFVKSRKKTSAVKKTLIIGASTGFGLASRITSAFSSDSPTIGVFFEKPPSQGKPATAGWYNTAAFEEQAHKAGLYAKSINGDAFSNEIKQKTIELIKADLGQVDLIIYSLASPKRIHPVTGYTHSSVIKPIGEVFTNKTVDFHTGIVSSVSINPATDDEIANTIAVMGGEDWAFWIEALKEAGVLANDVLTIAYSYIGPSLTEKVYRQGTIGRAKDHLEATAGLINEQLKDINGQAVISVNKALVTQSSSAIPVIPLYISLLYKVMKSKKLHEGCIEQIQRLFEQRIFLPKGLPTDVDGRVRIDDWEMRDDVQAEVADLWLAADTENLVKIGDLNGYKIDFLNLFGFDLAEVNYEQDVNEMVDIPSLVA